MKNTKIHNIDHVIYGVLFVLIAIAGFVYFSSITSTNTRAAKLPKEDILKCYQNHKPEICPDEPPQPRSDKNLRVCNMCYNKCMVCEVARRISDEQCAVQCAQDADPIETEETPTATPIPLQ